MPLFEVAIIEEPTKKEAEEGQQEKLIFGPEAIIARDIGSAGIVVVLENEGLRDVTINKDRMKVLIRPFA